MNNPIVDEQKEREDLTALLDAQLVFLDRAKRCLSAVIMLETHVAEIRLKVDAKGMNAAKEMESPNA